ncbi:amidohydrolase family protein [Brevibacterium sp. 91QC2O2]|uniref:amidohydrolase family protein n=1 Tax=Brevibacterium sp. 91QC2O2 TaxID=2968458 RepID=UPI00211BE1DE|nr:amidohydrolase family protein [Brevibacterium sp. 91QC2O2]
MTASRRPMHHDILITGGTLVDPQNGLHGAYDVGIRDGKISYVGAASAGDIPAGPPAAARTIDATGLIITPGFIDLHSHAQNIEGHRLQAQDGVTTTLELECGVTPLPPTVEAAEAQGRPLNFGYSAGWLHARAIVMEDMDAEQIAALPQLPLDAFAAVQSLENWKQPADAAQIDRIVELLDAQLAAGAIGIGLLLGYAPLTGADELTAVARLAKSYGRPLIVHVRWGSGASHGTPVGVQELIDLSRSTGVAVHICHISSSNSSAVPGVAQVLADAHAEGLPVTFESYPFAYSSTVIGADFLDPQKMSAQGTPADSLTYLRTGERPATYQRLAELRAQDPGGLCLADSYPDSEQGPDGLLVRALTLPHSVFASDAMPTKPTSEGPAAHPRSTSTFVRALAWLHRDLDVLPLAEVVARSTTLPAQVLRGCAPAFAAKGHLGVGADADIAVFALAELEPAARAVPVQAARGMRYVFVAGEPVVAEGRTVESVQPGRALLAE